MLHGFTLVLKMTENALFNFTLDINFCSINLSKSLFIVMVDVRFNLSPLVKCVRCVNLILNTKQSKITI